MYQVQYLNPISPKGTALWTENYQTTEKAEDAQAIMVRSAPTSRALILPSS